jgi:hypothetical protein
MTETFTLNKYLHNLGKTTGCFSNLVQSSFLNVDARIVSCKCGISPPRICHDATQKSSTAILNSMSILWPRITIEISYVPLLMRDFFYIYAVLWRPALLPYLVTSCRHSLVWVSITLKEKKNLTTYLSYPQCSLCVYNSLNTTKMPFSTRLRMACDTPKKKEALV